MKKLLLFPIIISCFLSEAQTPAEVWETSTFVDGNVVQVNQFRKDPFGNMYSTGYVIGSTSGDQDIYISKNDENGDEVFSDLYDSGAGADEAFDVRVDQSGNIYVIGNCRGGSSLFLRKYNSAGVVQWTETYHGAIVSTAANDAAFRSATGETYITGRLTNAVTGEGANMFLIKYLSDGSIDWEISYDDGNNNGDFGHQVVVDGSGNSYVLGERNVVGTGTPLFRSYSSTGTFRWGLTPDTDGDDGSELKMETNSHVAIYTWTGKKRYHTSNGVQNQSFTFDNTVQLFTSSLDYHLLSDGGYVRVDPNGVRRYDATGTQLAFNGSSASFYRTIMSGDDKLYVLPVPTTGIWKVRKYAISTSQVSSEWIYDYGENLGFAEFRLTDNNTLTISAGDDSLYLHRICLPPDVEILLDPSISSICPGHSVEISADAEYADTFDWWGQGPTGSSSSVFDWSGGGGLTDFEPINLSVTVDAGNGCVFDMGIPTIQGARYIDNFILGATEDCLDDPGFLQSLSAGNEFEQIWFFDGVQQGPQSDMPQYTVSNGNGTYGLVTVDLATGCASVDTLEHVVNDLLPTEDASFSYGSNTYQQNQTNPVANITGVSGGTFTETNGNVVFANSTTGEIDLLASTPGGPYTITYTTGGTCPGEETVEVTITSIPTGIQNQEMSFGFYPNPVTDVLKLNGEFTTVSVYTVSGSLVKATSAKQLDVSGLESAVYLLKAENHSAIGWHRFLKN